MNIKNEIYKDLHVRSFFPNNEIEKVIVAIHGFAGDKDSSVIYEIAKEMTTHNFVVVTFDLPNHGENESNGCLSLSKCFKAVNDIDLFVKEKYIGKEISCFATSFGGYLLLNLLSSNNYIYDKVILRAPAVHMDEILSNVIIPEHGYNLSELENKSINLGYGKELLIDINFYNDLKNNRLINNYKNNNYLYIIQGKKDDVVDYKNNEKFFNDKCFNNHEVYYFEEANHRFKNPGELEKIVEIVKNVIIK